MKKPTLTTDDVSNVSDEIMEAVRRVASKHGLQVAQRGISLKEHSVSTKIELVPIKNKKNPLVNTKEGQEFTKYASSKYKLKPEFLGKEFTMGKRTYTVLGANPAGRKYPIIASDERGRRWRFPAKDVAAAFRSPNSKRRNHEVLAQQRGYWDNADILLDEVVAA